MRTAHYDRKEFEALRKRLHVEIAGAHDEFFLARRLEKAKQKNFQAFAQSRVFWTLTINSLYNSSIARLCRVYDNTYPGILMYLTFVSQHQQWFNQPRVSDHPSGRDVPPKVFQASALNKAISSVSETSDKSGLVDQILELRNTQVAHIGTTFTTARRSKPKKPLSFKGFNTLLNRAHKLLNEYSEFYDDSTYVQNIVGLDDFKFVVDAVDSHLKAIRSRNDGK